MCTEKASEPGAFFVFRNSGQFFTYSDTVSISKNLYIRKAICQEPYSVKRKIKLLSGLGLKRLLKQEITLKAAGLAFYFETDLNSN